VASPYDVVCACDLPRWFRYGSLAGARVVAVPMDATGLPMTANDLSRSATDGPGRPFVANAVTGVIIWIAPM